MIASLSPRITPIAYSSSDRLERQGQFRERESETHLQHAHYLVRDGCYPDHTAHKARKASHHPPRRLCTVCRGDEDNDSDDESGRCTAEQNPRQNISFFCFISCVAFVGPSQSVRYDLRKIIAAQAVGPSTHCVAVKTLEKRIASS